MAVAEYNSPENKYCQHCIENSGCSIHEERADKCKQFRCGWLRGDMSEEMRPDKTSVIIEKLPGVPVVLALSSDITNVFKISDVLKEEYADNGIAVVTGRQSLLPKGVTIDDVAAAVIESAKTMGIH